jgi:MFS family permease
MTGLLRKRLAESLRAFGDVFRNRNLRRLELAWAGSITGEWAAAVAVGVFAFRSGGAAAVGLVGVIRFVPAAVAAPFTALLADRYPRERVMLGADLVRCAATAGAAAAVFTDAPAGVVYALVGFVSLASTAFQPAQAAVLPSLSRTPDELTAANVASSTIESVGSFIGPALGGLLLALTDTGEVLVVTAGLFLWSAFQVAAIRAPAGEADHAEPPPRPRFVEEAAAGFRVIGEDRRLRLLVGLYTAQTLVAGALNVLIVVCAIELLDLGEPGVGYLNSAVGIGGLIGAGAALALVGRRRLAADFGVGLVLWGLPIAAIALWPEPAAAVLLLAVVGIGNTVVDVAGLTLLQRAVRDEVLARFFGVLESLIVLTIGIGAVLAPVLIDAFGIRGALAATGALLPLLAVLAWRPLNAIDAETAPPGDELDLLRNVPIFAPLPASTLEHLARSLVPVQVAAGDEVFHQGETGDRFYVVRAGEVEVSADGQTLTTLGPGGYFGEIALLRPVSRTATARATAATNLLALEQDEFIGAVTGHPASAEAADAVIGARLGSVRTGLASL